MLTTNFEQCTTLMPKAEKRSSALYQSNKGTTNAIEDIYSSTKVVRNDFLDKRIEMLGKKLQEFEDSENQKFKTNTENLRNMKDNLERAIENKEKYIHLKLGTLLLDKEKQIGTLQTEIKNRKVQESKILKHLDDKISTLKGDLTREVIERNESIEWSKKALDIDIQKIFEEVNGQGKINREFLEGLIAKFNPEIKNLIQDLEQDRIYREDHEKAVTDMKNDILERARKEIEQEKNERMACEGNLYSLLESACAKINDVI
jgi:hypothetical protein